MTSTLISMTFMTPMTTDQTQSNLVIGGERKTKTVCCYLTDADWAICAGNWMWISSSAFEGCLSNSFDSRSYG